MPVVPLGVEPFEIQPPITSSLDDGRPSAHLLLDAQRVFDLMQDERHLTAEDLLKSVEERLGQASTQTEENQHHRKIFMGKKGREANRCRETALLEIAQVKELLTSRAALLEKLRNRCRLFRRAQTNLNENDEWTFASEHFGIKTFYRREADKSLTVKLEGIIEDAPLFEQICVLKEFGLHCKWAPFCFSSQTIADLDKLDTVGWFLLGLQSFGLARDGVIRAMGCDNTLEDGSVILAGQGVCDVKPGMPDHADGFLSDDPIIKQLDIPSVPKKRGTGRMTIRTFEAVIQVLSPTSAKTRVVTNIDPNISFLPASLLEFIMKHLAGVVLSKMQQAAKRITQNPKGNPHARRMRQERAFYETWLLPKCTRLCESRGWQMTPVPYFSLKDSREDMEQRPAHLEHVHSDTHVTSSTPMVSNRMHKRAESADDISEISNDSSLRSRLSRNPISQFLKREEQKAQDRKAKYIEEFRRRAADRLTPLELGATENVVLSRLRRAKVERSDHPARSVTTETDVSTKFFDQLKGHGPFTRVIVLSSLLLFLFQSLHPVHIVDSFSMSINSDDPWSRIFMLELGTVLHLLFCTILHYLVCGVALVYTFDTLEVGSKTGKRVRDFYGENVMKGVLVFSLAVVALSMTMATATFSAAIPWSILKIVDWFIQQTHTAWEAVLQLLPEVFIDTFTTATTVLGLVLSVLLSWVDGISNHFAGGQSISSSLLRPLIRLVDLITKAGRSFSWKQAMMAWGEDTFALAQHIFMYSAVFLVIAVTMFHRFTGKGSRVKEAFDGLFRPQKEV